MNWLICGLLVIDPINLFIKYEPYHSFCLQESSTRILIQFEFLFINCFYEHKKMVPKTFSKFNFELAPLKVLKGTQRGDKDGGATLLLRKRSSKLVKVAERGHADTTLPLNLFPSTIYWGGDNLQIREGGLVLWRGQGHRL